MQNGAVFDPVIVRAVGAQRYRVIDGKHRVWASRALGVTHLPMVFQSAPK